jgi:dihydrofolate reductase
MKVSIVVAFDKNGLIGKNGALPWNIPEDLKIFKERTLNHPIIVGRKTYDSLPKKPLKSRLNIVVTRTGIGLEPFQMDGYSQFVHFQLDLKAAIKFATMYCPNNDEIFIIGGKQIYETALNEDLVDKIYATEVFGDYEGDVYFPPLPAWERNLLELTDDFQVVEYERRQEIDSGNKEECEEDWKSEETKAS